MAPCALCGILGFAGLPAQDATSEMHAKAAQDDHDAEVAMLIGAGLGLVTVIAGIWLIVLNRRLSRRVG